MGETERPQADAGRDDRSDDLDQRRAAVLGRDVAHSEVQAPDIGRERSAPDDPDQERRDAILGRHRDSGQERGQGRDRDRER